MTTTKLIEYVNGNTIVSIYSDGTKVRKYSGIPHPLFPETIDLKITNRCNNGCLYCHEKSSLTGKHCDTAELYEKIGALPAGIELAIGGGNPIEHPALIEILQYARGRGLIPNITINQRDGAKINVLDLVYGLGVSLDGTMFPPKLSDNMVCHVIAGIAPFPFIKQLVTCGYRVLILGYKQYGFGNDYYSARKDSIRRGIAELKMRISEIVGCGIISFDNLAIEQLDIKRLFTPDGWKSFYMGDDFCFSMYIDAVEQEYAPTSRSNNRTAWGNLSISEYFIKNRAR